MDGPDRDPVFGSSPRPPVAVVFDMDGTLLKLPVRIDAARAALAEHFHPWGISQPFRPILTRIRDAALEAAAQGGDPIRLAREGFQILDAYEVEAAAHATACPHAPDVVSRLARAGVRLGLLTDNGRACVPIALRNVGIDPADFVTMATRDDVPAPKPDAGGLVQVAQALRPFAVMWYIGDTVKDVETGRAARHPGIDLRCVAVAGGLGDAADLERAGPDARISDLGDLIDLIGL